MRSVVAERAVAVLRVGQQRDAEAVLGEVGEAVPGHLVAGEVGRVDEVRRALDRAELHLVGRVSGAHRDAGSATFRSGAPRASRRRSGTRAAARPRRGARLARAMRSPIAALEGDLARSGRSRSTRAASPGGQSARVSRWNGSTSHASQADGPVVVELEHVAGRGQRLAAARAVHELERGRRPGRAPRAGARSRADAAAVERSTVTASRRRDRRARAERRARDERSSPAGVATTARRATPSVLTGRAARRRRRRARRAPPRAAAALARSTSA